MGINYWARYQANLSNLFGSNSMSCSSVRPQYETEVILLSDLHSSSTSFLFLNSREEVKTEAVFLLSAVWLCKWMHLWLQAHSHTGWVLSSANCGFRWVLLWKKFQNWILDAKNPVPVAPNKYHTLNNLKNVDGVLKATQCLKLDIDKAGWRCIASSNEL